MKKPTISHQENSRLDSLAASDLKDQTPGAKLS